MKIAVSACLLGDAVRYDGSHKRDEELIGLLEGHEIIRICPEWMSGFSIPHEALEIRKGNVYTKSGKNVTKRLRKGSERILQEISGCDLAILKSKSPSCGTGMIYDGTFSGKLTEGNGIFAQLCLDRKMIVLSEKEKEKIRNLLI